LRPIHYCKLAKIVVVFKTIGTDEFISVQEIDELTLNSSVCHITNELIIRPDWRGPGRIGAFKIIGTYPSLRNRQIYIKFVSLSHHRWTYNVSKLTFDGDMVVLMNLSNQDWCGIVNVNSLVKPFPFSSTPVFFLQSVSYLVSTAAAMRQPSSVARLAFDALPVHPRPPAVGEFRRSREERGRKRRSKKNVEFF
jgi:hypothetical protein